MTVGVARAWKTCSRSLRGRQRVCSWGAAWVGAAVVKSCSLLHLLCSHLGVCQQSLLCGLGCAVSEGWRHWYPEMRLLAFAAPCAMRRSAGVSACQGAISVKKRASRVVQLLPRQLN